MIIGHEKHGEEQWPIVGAWRVRVLAGVSPFWSGLLGAKVRIEPCNYLEIDCPFCGHRHRHGAGDRPGAGDGPRRPHCSGARPFSLPCYILREVGQMPDERPEGPVRKKSRTVANGAHVSSRTRTRIFTRDHFRCRRCGAGPNDDRLVIDHIVPVALGGTSEDENLQTLCDPCNQGKGDQPPHAHDLRAFS